MHADRHFILHAMFSKTECNGLKIYADRLQVSLTMTHKYLPTIISEMPIYSIYQSLTNQRLHAFVSTQVFRLLREIESEIILVRTNSPSIE